MTVLPFKPNNRNGLGPKSPVPPMFNVPPMTLIFIAIFAAVHLIFLALPADVHALWGYGLAFVPARYTDGMGIDVWAAVSPFTHLFLHGGWLHLGMNSVMLLAFGAGAERMLGAKKMLILFFVAGLCGALAQFLLAPTSPIPMIGASGAISGLFAALIIRLQQTGMMPMGRFGIWGIAAIWIGLSLVTAFVGGAMGVGNVAWAAHVGGFFAGIALGKTRFYFS